MSFSWHLCQQFSPKSTPTPHHKKKQFLPRCPLGSFCSRPLSCFYFEMFRGSVGKAGGVIQARAAFYFYLFCFLQYNIKVSFCSSCRWKIFSCPPSSSSSSSSAFSRHEKWQRRGVPLFVTSNHKSRVLPQPPPKKTKKKPPLTRQPVTLAHEC